MPAAYSQDLRDRALALMEAGTRTRAEVSQLLQIGESTLYEWQARKRAGHSTAPLPHGGGKVSDLDREQLAAIVAAENDLTLQEYAERYAARTGRRFDSSYLCRVLRQLKLPRKSQSAHRR